MVAEPAAAPVPVQCGPGSSSPATVASTSEAGQPDLEKPQGKPTISPRAARVAAELGVDWTVLKGSGRTGRIVERDVRRAAAEAPTPEQIKVTPVARRLAEAEGIDLAELAAQKAGRKDPLARTWRP